MADFPPVHPGEVLCEDFLKPLSLSQHALAKAIGSRRYESAKSSMASAQSILIWRSGLPAIGTIAVDK